eukprot:1313895-Rhodomonas_salina.3
MIDRYHSNNAAGSAGASPCPLMVLPQPSIVGGPAEMVTVALMPCLECWRCWSPNFPKLTGWKAPFGVFDTWTACAS